MQYIPVYGRFIGGVNVQQALKRCSGVKWTPIFDRAKEGNVTREDVSKSVGRILEDVNEIGDWKMRTGVTEAGMTGRGFYALKGSTFAFDKANVRHIYRISREVNLCGMDVLFDAETSDVTGVEDYYCRVLADSDIRFYKTYQMYRTDALGRLMTDLDSGLITRFKIVRGAYYPYESRQGGGVLLPSKKHVDHVYDGVMNYLLGEIIRGRDIHVMIATHNQASIDKALKLMGSDGVTRERVHFAKLLGMGEDVVGSRMCRYVPYGPLIESLPYLGRRLVENYPLLMHIKS